MNSFSVLVPLNTKEQRLDKFLATSEVVLQNCSINNRSHLKNIIQSVSVNEKKVKFSHKIKSGDVIKVDWEEIIPQNICPQDIPLKIVYEDENVTLLDKEQGMVTHPGAGNWTGTLVNALLFHWKKDSISNNSTRPGIVHRLDKDTSGLIITAKNIIAEDWLQKQFKDRRVKKEYIAIVCGRPPAYSGNIKTQIVRDSKNRKRYKALAGTECGKFAHTVYRCIACYGPFSLMRLRLKTGRTHQIRVHMKYLGCPILGDPIYGSKNSLFPEATLMLHSRLLAIRLPGEMNFSEFKAEVPLRFKKILKVLHRKYEKCLLTK
ncbi:MAG: RluA family pseudouridine synthase [Spirochaetaceae bacterium]|nr:RluA family pseudouridine synthase [Spirochaetaceae bacterium]